MRILCFGDSNTYGYDPRGFFGDRYGAEDRWVDLLVKQTGHVIINSGANGREIPRNPYVLRLLAEHAPVDIFLVMLGTNDLLQGASAKEAAARMEAFLNQLFPHCKHFLLVAPPPMKRGAWVTTDELVSESNYLAEEYQLLAEKLNIPFVDTRNWDIDLTFDGVHFTEEGHHMNFDFGNRIKSLRLSRSMTQEQLAQKLGVSAQAVSKWESGTNMPDILMLPDLSVIFGVTIDELFAMTDEHRMERIENMLYDVRFLSYDEFLQHEKYLKDLQSKPEYSAEAGLLLAMLYNKRANEYHELAKPLARTALLQIPGKKDAHNAIFDAEHGPYQDWNFINHGELIEFYKSVTAQHPEDIRNYFWLLDLLIADHRTAEARNYVEQMKALEHSYHYEMYMGYICQAECDLPEAMNWWQKMLNNYQHKWQVWFEYGSIMAKLGRYEEALEYFQKGQPMRPKPRFTDCEDAISQICVILGDIDGAIEAQKQMLQVMKEDWTSEGESVDSILKEIKRLESLKN